MHLFRKILPLALAASTTACLNLNLDGVALGGIETDPNVKIENFRCDNGYKVSIKHHNENSVRVAFNDGKNTYVPDAHRVPAASGDLYENSHKTLKWHQKNDSGILTYPAADYGTSKKLLETSCKKY